ncbi:MAG TPA: alkaline phosphatase family protein [Microthrixaceae bacterium]|nr:alkaline phosphatase family protein [Microthrixaceae bacterium]
MARSNGFDRRAFLRATGLTATAAVLGESMLAGCTPSPDYAGIGAEYQPSFVPQGSILDLPASSAPIDHVVILMMENRSFDHYLGWLGRDGDYLRRGVERYGPTFRIDAQPNQTYLDSSGNPLDTYQLTADSMNNPWRGCGFDDPGHSWDNGRAQRDLGFLGAGTGNDRFAIGYHGPDDLPFTSRMAKRFTTFDRYHASLLGPTQPNREYLHGGQSGGHKDNYIPILELGFKWRTIWDQLRKAGVSARSYSPDLPSLAFFGERMAPMLHPIDKYFSDCKNGKLPSVTFLDPPYLPWWQADDHPLADPAAGQRYLTDTFRAFAKSPHWKNGLFILTYDEWGGFFDHVQPPLLPDDRSSNNDQENFSQAGFRVPTILASPYSRPGYVDHRTYDHTSIMRFLQWRFLGAPPEGPGGDNESWSLTKRNRYAHNLGASLGYEDSDPGLFDLDDLPLRAPTRSCEGVEQLPYPGAQPHSTSGAVPGDRSDQNGQSKQMLAARSRAASVDQPVGGPGNDLLEALEAGYFERVGIDPTPSDMAGEWVKSGVGTG